MKIWAPLCFLAVAFAQDDDERKKLTEAEKVNIFKLNTVTSATRKIFSVKEILRRSEPFSKSLHFYVNIF